MATQELIPHPELRLVGARRALRKMIQASQDAEGGLVDSLLKNSSEGVFVVDAERNVLMFNKRAEELTGFTASEVIGRHCLTGFRCTHCLESCRLFDRGRVRGAHLDLFQKDGTRIDVAKTASVVRDKNGHVIGAVEMFRKRTVQGAPETSQGGADATKEAIWAGLDAMMAALGRGAVLVDRSFLIRRASSVFSSVVGRPVEGLLGQPLASLLGDDVLAEDGLFRTALASGERREGWRALVSLPDGGSAAVSLSGAPFPGVEMCGTDTDETPRFVLVVRPEDQDQGAEGSGPDPDGPTIFEGIVARSKSMHRVFSLIDHLRESDATVLVSGESGTGKELVARAIHARSSRANQPFVAVNCGALPGELLETELFGHVRGAFTGAVRDKAGRCEVVGEGTLFLDEIGDLPLPLQVKLLRLLQERSFERVGETGSRPFKARVVAATHRDLRRAVAEKTFRDDLFYRLNVVPVKLPALRDRREDVELLLEHLLEKIGQRRSRALRLSPSAVRALLAHDWPGNVRQLENALEYATAVCDGQTIHVEDLPAEVIAGVEPPTSAATEAPRESTRPHVPPVTGGASGVTRARYPEGEAVIDALKRTRFHRIEAAKLLGVSRTTLWRRMKELGLA